MEALALFGFAWIGSACMASVAATSKRRSEAGWFVAALFLGPLALFGLAACAPAGRPCVMCREAIDPKAALCPLCRTSDPHGKLKEPRTAAEFMPALTSEPASK